MVDNIIRAIAIGLVAIASAVVLFLVMTPGYVPH